MTSSNRLEKRHVVALAPHWRGTRELPDGRTWDHISSDPRHPDNSRTHARSYNHLSGLAV